MNLEKELTSTGSIKTGDFDYQLPPELIAQVPVEPRDHSRLMVIHRSSGKIEHRHFYQIIGYLKEGDLLVLNNSKVVPARLKGRKMKTGGKVEFLLLKQMEPNLWEALARPAHRLMPGTEIELSEVKATVTDCGERGIRYLKFDDDSVIERIGEVALPPYIHTKLENKERYQTIYSQEKGSVAAPTAGLHFTPELLKKIEDKGIQVVYVTLHVGLDSFRPVEEENPAEHRMHSEYGVVDEKVTEAITRAKNEGRRVVCGGTTTCRLLESTWQKSGGNKLKPFSGWTDLFILPGYQFGVIDILLTNFHLPRSTLLMLVSAFTGRELILNAYHEAIKQRYRFYSFGDCMFIF